MRKLFVLTVMLSMLMATALSAQQFQWNDEDGNVFVEKRIVTGGDRPFLGERRFMGKRQHQGMGQPMLLCHADELDLTEKQISQIKELSTQFQLDKVDKKAELKKAQIMQKALMHDEDANERAVFSGIDEIAMLKADLKKMMYSHHQAVKNILTDEQKDKLKELRKGGLQKHMNFEGKEGKRGMRKKIGRHGG